MKDEFDSFWERLSRKASGWQSKAPTEVETRSMADQVLRQLRVANPDSWTWWMPLARNLALASLVVALITIPLTRTGENSFPVESKTLASSLFLHALQQSSDYE